MVFRLGSRHLSAGAAALAAAALLFTPLALGFGRAALPNAPMVALSTAAMLLATRGNGIGRAVVAALLFAAAILLKPLALATAVALAVWLTFGRRWRALALMASTGAAAAVCSWVFFDLISEGGFTELVRQQLVRFREVRGFDLFREYAPFARLTDARGWHTQLAWNLAEHRRALGSLALGRGADSNGLVTAGAVAALLLWPWLATTRRRLVGLCLVWLAVPLSFNLLVWGPVWNHYFLQYLPPLALLTAVGVDESGRLAAARWGRPGLRLAPLILVGALLVALAWHARLQLKLDPRSWAPLRPRQSVWLTLDPTLHLVSDTRPACGVYDPFNVYGPAAFAAQPGFGGEAFTVGFRDLVACLEEQPEIRIFVTHWTTWFIDNDQQSVLARRFPDRIVFQDPRQERTIRHRIERGAP
jgi:4-amino-4-deoxy-L-arabinose transferase-like glycosyltransferase